MLRGIHCELRLRGSSLEIFGECWVTSVLMPETQHFGDLILAVQDFSRPSTWIWGLSLPIPKIHHLYHMIWRSVAKSLFF